MKIIAPLPEHDPSERSPAFVWSAGAWFGSQIGSTTWMLILGFLLLGRDRLVGALCVTSFLALNTWGIVLWRRRSRLSAYSGFQRLLAAVAVITAIVVVSVNVRGLSQPSAPGELVSTYLPYGAIGIVPAMMLVFAWRERASRSLRR